MVGRYFFIAALLTLCAVSAHAQTEEELEQARVELAEKYDAASAQLQQLAAELPEIIADSVGLAKKEDYVDRIFALRGDLEILKADLDFIDFRLAGLAAGAGAALVDGDTYFLTDALDEAKQPLGASGFTDQPHGFDQASFAFDVPSTIVIGQPITFGGSAQYTSDCLKIYESRTGLNPGFDTIGIGTQVRFSLGSSTDVVFFARWVSDHAVVCNHNPDPLKYTGGNQTSSTSLQVTLSPDPVEGDEAYRYAANYESDGPRSDGWDHVDIYPTGVIVIEVRGIGRKGFFVYKKEPGARPLALAPFEHPDPPEDFDPPGPQTDDPPGRQTDDPPGRQTDDPPGPQTDDPPGRQPDDPPGRQTDDPPGRQTDDPPGRQTDQPRVSDYPDVIALIEEWLRVAEPPQNATEGADLRYDPWGRLEGTTQTGTITLSGPPDDAGSQPSIEYVWARADDLDSVDHCTLNDFVERSINGESLAYCKGRFQREEVPDAVGNPIHIAVEQMTEAGLTPELVAGDPAPEPGLAGTIQAVGPLRGDKIVLVVFTQPEGVNQVPDLTGMRMPEAQAVLADAGLEMRPQLGDPAAEPELEGQIYRQDPPAGTAAQANSAISVFVYGAAPVVDEAWRPLDRILVPSEIAGFALSEVHIRDLSDFVKPIRAKFGDSYRIPASRFTRDGDKYSIQLPVEGWPWSSKPADLLYPQMIFGMFSRFSLIYGGPSRIVLSVDWDSQDLADHPRASHIYGRGRERKCPLVLFSQRGTRGYSDYILYVLSLTHDAYVEIAVHINEIPVSVLETAARSIVDQLETNADRCAK